MFAGCEQGVDSPRGFSLPEGDTAKGRMVFVKYQCLGCHQLQGFSALPGEDNNPELNIRLGGKSSKVKTYAELVTSVINPSHKFARGYPLKDISEDGKSKMKNYNDIMSISELIDLVAFLQPQYELVPYRRTNYEYYP
jgi:mono/diheme cytochrome c family protein